jgi:hypothetical protein
MSTGGKGSRPRPYSVDQKTFDNNWDAIFKKNKQTEVEKFDSKVIMRNEYYDQDVDPDNPDQTK